MLLMVVRAVKDTPLRNEPRSVQARLSSLRIRVGASEKSAGETMRNGQAWVPWRIAAVVLSRDRIAHRDKQNAMQRPISPPRTALPHFPTCWEALGSIADTLRGVTVRGGGSAFSHSGCADSRRVAENSPGRGNLAGANSLEGRYQTRKNAPFPGGNLPSGARFGA
jgi:hypothetical protein